MGEITCVNNCLHMYIVMRYSKMQVWLKFCLSVWRMNLYMLFLELMKVVHSNWYEVLTQ